MAITGARGDVYKWADSVKNIYEFILENLTQTVPTFVWTGKCLTATSRGNGSLFINVGDEVKLNDSYLGSTYQRCGFIGIGQNASVLNNGTGLITIAAAITNAVASVANFPVVGGDIYDEVVNNNKYTYCVTGSAGAITLTPGKPAVGMWFMTCVAVHHGGVTPTTHGLGYVVVVREDQMSKFSAYLGNNAQLLAAANAFNATPATFSPSGTVTNPPGAIITNPRGVIPGATITSGPVVSQPPASQMPSTTSRPIFFTPGPGLKEVKRIKGCTCPTDHPHNERGCYMGMCGCRVGK